MSPLYFVEIDLGKLGRAFVETSRDSNARKGVVQLIASGEFEKVVTVLEVIEDEGSCRDVTEDVAREVADLLHASRDRVSRELGTWLQQQIDVTATRTLNFEHA